MGTWTGRHRGKKKEEEVRNFFWSQTVETNNLMKTDLKVTVSDCHNPTPKGEEGEGRKGGTPTNPGF